MKLKDLVTQKQNFMKLLYTSDNYAGLHFEVDTILSTLISLVYSNPTIKIHIKKLQGWIKTHVEEQKLVSNIQLEHLIKDIEYFFVQYNLFMSHDFSRNFNYNPEAIIILNKYSLIDFRAYLLDTKLIEHKTMNIGFNIIQDMFDSYNYYHIKDIKKYTDEVTYFIKNNSNYEHPQLCDFVKDMIDNFLEYIDLSTTKDLNYILKTTDNDND